jgi:hypothetical protein
MVFAAISSRLRLSIPFSLYTKDISCEESIFYAMGIILEA